VKKDKYNIKILDLVLDVRDKNGTKYITLPCGFCKTVGIKGEYGEQVRILVLEKRKGKDVEDFCHVMTTQKI